MTGKRPNYRDERGHECSLWAAKRHFNVLGRPSLASSWIQANGDLCRNRELLLTLAGWKAERLKLCQSRWNWGPGAQYSLFQAPGGVRDDQGLHPSSDLLGQMESSSPDSHWVAYPICCTTLKNRGF